jgi:rhomboid family GlyGly-CTERM serine protease
MTPLRVLFGLLGVTVLVLAVGGEPWREALRYERAALPLAQAWRWLTAHLVHLGPGHALLNVAGLALVVLLFGRPLSARAWAFVLLASAVAIDAGFWWLQPRLEWYVGLSGVLHGLFAAGALAEWRAGGEQAPWLLLALCAKLAFEQGVGPLPLTAASAGGPVVVAAHLYGALGGALAYVVMRARRRRRGARNG